MSRRMRWVRLRLNDASRALDGAKRKARGCGRVMRRFGDVLGFGMKTKGGSESGDKHNKDNVSTNTSFIAFRKPLRKIPELFAVAEETIFNPTAIIIEVEDKPRVGNGLVGEEYTRSI